MVGMLKNIQAYAHKTPGHIIFIFNLFNETQDMYAVMISWQLTLMKSFQAIGHVSSLKTTLSGIVSAPIIRNKT
jgi:hypothetical protein